MPAVPSALTSRSLRRLVFPCLVPLLLLLASGCQTHNSLTAPKPPIPPSPIAVTRGQTASPPVQTSPEYRQAVVFFASHHYRDALGDKQAHADAPVPSSVPRFMLSLRRIAGRAPYSGLPGVGRFGVFVRVETVSGNDGAGNELGRDGEGSQRCRAEGQGSANGQGGTFAVVLARHCLGGW